MKLRRLLRTGLPIVVLVSVAFVGAGCGKASESGSTNTDARSTSGTLSQYEEALGEFQVAASAGKTYDVYGYAESFPSTQRAAVDAFCFIADELRKNPKAAELKDPWLTAKITRKAEIDLKSERDIVAPRPTRRAIGKLRAILELELLDDDQAENYVRACY